MAEALIYISTMKINFAVSIKAKMFLIPQIGSHIPIHLLIKSKGVCQHYNVHVVFIEALLIISILGCNQDILQEMRRKKKNSGISTQWDFCFQKKKSIMPPKGIVTQRHVIKEKKSC